MMLAVSSLAKANDFDINLEPLKLQTPEMEMNLDCQAEIFTVVVHLHAHFGIKLLRVSDDQMKGPSAAMQKQGYKKGTVIKDSNLLPGDLIFYGSANYSSHTAVYIGNHKVVHAANTRMGIIITDIDWCPGRIVNHAMRYWA